MSANPVNASQMSVFLGNESTFGTPVAPNTLTLMEVDDFKTGPGEGSFRPKTDRHAARGNTNGFVQGRQPPIPWSILTSVKSRADADDVPSEDPLYKAAGLKRTINASTSVVYSLVSAPVESADFQALSALRALGHHSINNGYFAEVLRGAICSQLAWSGGDKELKLEASGTAIGKYTQGQADSLSVADGSTTSVTISAAESYRFSAAVGAYFQWESEIVRIAACTAGATSMTVTRAQLSSSGAAHTSAPFFPYVPALSVPTVTPISEVTSTVSLLGVTTRCTAWKLMLKTGMEMGPPETGSAYIQAPKVIRYEVTGEATLELKGNDITLLGKAAAGLSTSAISLVQGSAAGSINTFAVPYALLDPFEVPAPPNDIAMVTVRFRGRDNSGSDAMSLTVT